MAKTNVKGFEGLISVYDETAYKPLVCLTSTSTSRTLNVLEKVNYCTQGQPVVEGQNVSREVSVEGEVMKTLDVGEMSYGDLVELIEAMQPADFKIEGRDVSPQYFRGLLTGLTDTFPGEGNATFSGTIRVDNAFATVDPHGV